MAVSKRPDAFDFFNMAELPAGASVVIENGGTLFTDEEIKIYNQRVTGETFAVIAMAKTIYTPTMEGKTSVKIPESRYCQRAFNPYNSHFIVQGLARAVGTFDCGYERKEPFKALHIAEPFAIRGRHSEDLLPGNEHPENHAIIDLNDITTLTLIRELDATPENLPID